jgi:E-phenylitaconyl-CoA hydratase
MSVDLHIEDGIALVTLNRPEALNAIDYPMRRAIQALWPRLQADSSVDVIILTGAGERAFCVGSDLKNTPPPETSFAQETFGAGANDSLLTGLDTDKPILCAFNGSAYGGGLELGLAADIRICAPQAKFGLPEVRVGTLPGSGGTQHLPRLIGDSNALYMLLTGDSIDADTALRVGLVSHVVPASELRDTALRMAQRIRANAPLSVRAAKRLVRDGRDMPLVQALRHERQTWGLLRDTEDRKEGRAAFAENRKPRYTGR